MVSDNPVHVLRKIYIDAGRYAGLTEDASSTVAQRCIDTVLGATPIMYPDGDNGGLYVWDEYELLLTMRGNSLGERAARIGAWLTLKSGVFYRTNWRRRERYGAPDTEFYLRAGQAVFSLSAGGFREGGNPMIAAEMRSVSIRFPRLVLALRAHPMHRSFLRDHHALLDRLADDRLFQQLTHRTLYTMLGSYELESALTDSPVDPD